MRRQARAVRRVHCQIKLRNSKGEMGSLTDAPAADEGIHELVHDEDDSDPREPAGNIRCGTEGPVAA